MVYTILLHNFVAFIPMLLNSYSSSTWWWH